MSLLLPLLSMDEGIEKIKKFLDSLNGSIDDLQDKLQPIIAKSLDEVVAEYESPLEKIEIYNSYSYVLISIVVAYLRSTGVDTTNHPIMKELQRVKQYMEKHKALIAKKNSGDEAETKEYLQKTLGNKPEPAISSANFKETGKHKRFE